MFCAECGNAIRADLNYCNRCGAEVVRGKPGNQSIAETLSASAGAIGVFGMLGFVAIMWMMLSYGIGFAAGAGVTVLYLATLFGLCFLMLRQTAALTRSKAKRSTNNDDASGAPAYLARASTAQLEEPADPPASVTEHTTRTLEKIEVPRK